MKQLYTTLKGLLAVLLLSVPASASAQELADLAGNWTLTAESVTRADGNTDNLPPATYDVTITVDETSGTAYLAGFPSSDVNDPESTGGWQATLSSTLFGSSLNWEFPAGVTYTLSDGATLVFSSESDENAWQCRQTTSDFTIVQPTGDYLVFDYTNGETTTTVKYEGITMTKKTVTPAPADMAGTYSISTGDQQINITESSYLAPESINMGTEAEITIDAEGKALMTGLIGTPQNVTVDISTWTYVYSDVYSDSSYVGTYDAEAQTLTFSYPEGYYMETMASNWYYYYLRLLQPVTFSVSKDESGKYVLSTSDALSYNLAVNDYENNIGTLEVAGATLTQISGETQTVEVTLTPAPGHYETMPSTFVVRTGAADIAELNVNYITSANPRQVITLDAEAITLDADSAKFTLPTEAVENQSMLTLMITGTDADGSLLVYDGSEEDIQAQYTADVSANTFTAESIEPADGSTVESLSTFTVTFSGAANGKAIGGFDTSKAVTLQDAEGNEVTTATIDWSDPSDFSCISALVTLATEVTETGTYKLVIPEGTVYDEMFDDWADDFGVSYGATYNPEITATYTVATPALPLADAVTSLDELSNESTYAIYNDHFQAYLAYEAEFSTTNVWAADMVGDSGHQKEAETNAFDAANPGYAWMIVKGKEEYYVYNMEAQMYLQTPSYSTGETSACTFTETPTPIQIEALGNGTFALNTTGETYGYMCAAPQLSSYPISIWTSSDSGSAWAFKANPNVEADASVASVLTDIRTAVAEHEDAADGGVYTLSGVKISTDDTRKLPAGVYIINRKKVIVK